MRRVALLLACVSGSAIAQVTPGTVPPPKFDSADPNGVDLVTGELNFSIVEGSIGDGANGVSLVSSWVGTAGWQNNWNGTAYLTTIDGTTGVSVALGEYSDKFKTNGSGGWIAVKGNGATLTGDISTGVVYTASDGTVIRYMARTEDSNLPLSGFECPDQTPGACNIPVSITRPDGAVFTLKWTIATLPLLSPTAGYYRFEGVTGPSGFDFTINYVTNSTGSFSVPQANWYKRTQTVFSNVNAPPATPLTSTYTTPAARPTTMVDTLGRTWSVTLNSGGFPVGIKRPGASSDTTTISYGAGGVSSITRNGVTTNYSRTVSGTTATTVITYADSTQRTVVANTALGRVTDITDQLGNITKTNYDTDARPIEVIAPELNRTLYAYDGRGNVTTTTARAKPASGLADIVTYADYAPTCANPLICNKPIATRDAKGNQTDYAYSPTTGQVTSVTAPAPTSGAVRPQTRYSYVTTGGVSLLTGVSACQTTASCVGTADEVKTTIAYNAALQPTSVSSGAGDGSLTATTAFTYDAYGNRTYTDGPLPGTADTTRTIYDLARQPVGVIGPDPDSAGALKHRAARVTYNADGQTTLSEAGTTNGQSDADWAAFVSLQSAASSYDGNARKVTDSIVAGGTTYALTQYSYDTLGQLTCTTQRMNTAAFGSLPSSACAFGTEGSFGLDRITYTPRDAVGRAQGVYAAYGTLEGAWDSSYTYSPNGRLVYLSDGNANYTYHVYDGFDRLILQYFPSKTTPGQIDPTNYTAFAFDANGNVTQQRLRDGYTIGYTFDALDRVTAKDVPAIPGAFYDLDLGYTYDNLGRLRVATNSGGAQAQFVYDALGRVVTEYGAFSIKTYQYDLAGRMTRMDMPGGLFLTYDRFVTGEMGAVRENGATSGAGVLGLYAYDNLGRRTGVTRGNGTSTFYGYDPVSRLTLLSHDVAGAADDVTITFTHNPAGQIATRTMSNDSYAYTALTNRDTAETPNGLNQLITQAPSPGVGTLGYDGRGNVSALAGRVYGYTSENRLGTRDDGVYVAYEPLGRMLQLAQGSDVRFDYAGDALIAEATASAAVLRRYVHGPGVDEVLTWYEGSGGPSGVGDRRWLLADERGSTIGITDGNGTVTNKLSYDDYGTPASANVGRIQYTGQAWLPELNLHYYKARMMNPAIGRFMQTDPIGYAGGMNLYAYVGGDPVNLVDPEGLRGTCTQLEGYDPDCGDNGSPTASSGIGRGGGAAAISGPRLSLTDAEAAEDIVVTGRGQSCTPNDLADLAEAAEAVGSVLADVGGVGEVIGQVVFVFNPVAGAAVYSSSRVLGLVGNGLQAAGSVTSGNYTGLGVQGASLAFGNAGRLASRGLRSVPFRGNSGRFINTPTGGRFKNAKDSAAGFVASKGPSCPVRSG